jgi:hypothetical protein
VRKSLVSGGEELRGSRVSSKEEQSVWRGGAEYAARRSIVSGEEEQSVCEEE